MIGTINPRKTFAIISHPDAGKTTLTEKLLLFGGAIQQAGAVKARGENRHARSDWMKVEQERGISVASSVMNFEYENTTFNLLDTPGHEDFPRVLKPRPKNCLKSAVCAMCRLSLSSTSSTVKGSTRSFCLTTLKKHWP